MRNYRAMSSEKLSRCLGELEAQSGDAYVRWRCQARTAK